ncbi:DNase1 protein [Trichocladium antarcticum]|uniref:DNase1 protein n=1 Tax=Trichocladium antarcticum TaxID=1450529 RepID=A0AAN6ZGL3_9PEZI|nr:DNase1 protein [Trichocladium antarcticum]
MKFISIALALAAAALGRGENTVKLVSQDSVDRTVHFTGNPGMPAIETVTVRGHQNVTVDMPHGWIGNWFAVSRGAAVAPGMLGEVAFNSWGGVTFFDVSAIVNAHDHVGVKKMWPAASRKPSSGCDAFPCAFAYYLPDDVQTQATRETDLICTLGGGGDARNAAPVVDAATALVFPREFVTGRGLPVQI